jgi:hypothetical protein
MAKAPKRKLKVTKTERRTILKAAAKHKPKPKPEKPGRKKRKPIEVSREAPPPLKIRRPRGPDLKPRKRRTSMATKNAKLEGEDEDNGDDVKDTKGKDTKGDVPIVDPPKPPNPPGLIVGEDEVAIYDNSSGRWKTQKAV